MERLDLGWNQIADEGVEALVSSPLMRGLRALSLLYNNITDRGIEALASDPSLGSLRELKLSSLTEHGLRTIEQSPYLGDEVKAMIRTQFER